MKAMAIHTVAGEVRAGGELVTFLERYDQGVLYATVERGNITEEIFTSRAAVARGKEVEDGFLESQWRKSPVQRRSEHAPAVVPAGRARVDGDQVRMRHGAVRHLHGAPRRHGGAELHHACRWRKART
jgi:hypothetical protein